MEEQGNEEDEEPEEHVKKMDKIILKCAEQLDSLWSKIELIINSDGGDDMEKASKLSEEVSKITSFLIAASKKENLVNVACVFCEKYQPFYKIYNWTGKHRACLKQMACEQLRYFKEIVFTGGVGLLTSKHIMIPLYLLLLSLQPKEKRKVPLDIELLFINILYYLSQKIENPAVLDMLSTDLYTDDGFKINKYTFFELLILYTHNPGEAGNIAREGILSCVKVSLNNQEFSQYISQESSGCIIIAAGLSGRYSSLPTTLELKSDDWNCITKFDVDNMAELQVFLHTLKFCCNITEVGNKSITSRLCTLIYESFLMHVVGPVLNQSSIESQISITAYLDLFLRSITSTHIMRIFLRFLLTDTYDNKPLIDVLISHINSETAQLSVVAIQLFKTLLELNCEDVLYHLIFRYLIGCYHVAANQKRTIKEVDFYCKSATMFLYLTPQCCIESNKQTNDIAAEEANPVINQDGSISAITPEMKRKLSTGSASSKSSDTSNLSELRTEEALDFMCYLHDVKRTITSCKKACSCWSAVYDGMDVITENNSLSNGKRSDSKLSFMEGIIGSFDGPRTNSMSNPSTMTSNLTSAISKIDFSLNGNSADDDCLGPFLNAIFDKIEAMIDNNVYVNLMLTSLVTRLACYPQPLLRSFLLNSNLVIKPGVRSLVQVIARVSSVADGLVGQLDDFKVLITKARQALRDREHNDLNSLNNNNNTDKNTDEQPCSIELDCSTGAGRFERTNTFDSDDRSMDSLLSLSIGSRNKSFNTSEMKLNTNGFEKSSTLTSPPDSAGRLHPVLPKLIAKSPKKRRNIFSKSDVLDLRRTNPSYIRNAIYCVVILEEFMKELAAVSIEQTLL